MEWYSGQFYFLHLLTSDNSLVSSVLGTEVAGFRGDSKCPRKLLNEKSAT
jgi:hypothetical protein